MTRKSKILSTLIPSRYRPFGFLPLHGVGVELGSREGLFAESLLKIKSIRKLIVVDPFTPYQDGPSSFVTMEMQAKYLASGIKRLSRFTNCSRMTMTSKVASEAFPSAALDFIYIDGDHSYEATKLDIESWWPKMRAGAIFGGHDFHHTWPGVIKAVLEHCNNYGLALCVETPDWWIKK